MEPEHVFRTLEDTPPLRCPNTRVAGCRFAAGGRLPCSGTASFPKRSEPPVAERSPILRRPPPRSRSAGQPRTAATFRGPLTVARSPAPTMLRLEVDTRKRLV